MVEVLNSLKYQTKINGENNFKISFSEADGKLFKQMRKNHADKT